MFYYIKGIITPAFSSSVFISHLQSMQRCEPPMSLNKLTGQRVSSLSTPPTTQMSSSVSGVTSPPRACCENGRPIMTDPHTGQTICSCQYGTALLNYSRVQGLPDGVYGASAAAYAVGATQGYVPLGTEGSAFYSPLGNPAFDMKEGTEAWRALAAQSGGCFPYDPSMALYPYGGGYGGLDLNARRKNATRETTNTLKAWLYEHRKNPYPTKGEKIMLAIITKMTLTQVSTWFANARRRLKKENKMTWSPRNRSEDDASGDEDGDSKTNGNDSDTANLNTSVDDNHDDRSINKDVLDRIISVDEDDDSDHSDVGDLDDSESHTSHGLNGDSAKDLTQSAVSDFDKSSVPGVSNNPKITSDDDKNDRLNRDQERSTNSESEPQTNRPKIWSVTDFLVNKDKESSTSTPGASSPAIVCSRQPNNGQFLNFHQTSQSFRNGHFPVGFRGYPLSLTHSTLSYPYTLSSSTDAKTDISLKHAHAAALRAEQAFKEGLVERSAKLQNGLFSPARELDGLRVGGKVVL